MKTLAMTFALGLAAATCAFAGPSASFSDAVTVSIGVGSKAADEAVEIDAFFRTMMAAVGSTRLYTNEMPGMFISVR